MGLNDLGEKLWRRVWHPEPDASAQERWRDPSLAVARHYDEWDLVTAHLASRDRRRPIAPVLPDLCQGQLEASKLRNLVLAALENVEEVVRKVDIGFVDLVD